MSQNKSKIKVAVSLKNGDYLRIACSSIEYDAYGIEIWTLNNTIKFYYEDISLMSIFIGDEQSENKLLFKSVI